MPDPSSKSRPEAGFDQIPIDNVWGTTIPLATEVCAAIGDGERAAQLYDLLSRYQGSFPGGHNKHRLPRCR